MSPDNHTIMATPLTTQAAMTEQFTAKLKAKLQKNVSFFVTSSVWRQYNGRFNENVIKKRKFRL